MSFAVTISGVTTDTQEEVRAELVSKLQATFGVNVNTTTSSNFGQLTNILSEYRATAQQAALAIAASFDPDSATGVLLDQRAALTGTTRKGATQSDVTGVLTFSAAGTVSDGDLISNSATGTQWAAINGPYVIGAAGDIAATFQAVDTGPLAAAGGTAWTLVTAVPNLTGFANTEDAVLGRDEETDPDFRRRRRTELYSQGIGFKAAISAVASRVDGVDTVRTYHNPSTQPADADGIPFKAFNVVFETTPTVPGTALQVSICEAILSATGAGGQAYGTDYTQIVLDSEGQSQPISFDTITLVPIYVSVTVSTTGTEQVVSEGMAEVIEAQTLETANTTLNNINQDQYSYTYLGIVAALQAEGSITGATSVTIGISRVSLADAISGGSDPVAIGKRERPSFSSANIQATVA